MQAASKAMAQGYAYVSPDALEDLDLSDLHVLQDAFDHAQAEDPEPGRRWRSHSSFELKGGRLELAPHNAYVQGAEYNQDAGGRQRIFRPVERSVLESRILRSIIQFNAAVASYSTPQIFDAEIIKVGLHMVSYRPLPGGPSWASPMWLHRDEEEYVSVVLIGVSKNLGGGENVISPGGRQLSAIIDLQEPLEQLVLTKRVLHSVVPMHSRNNRPARRDILLVTFN